MLGFGAMIPVLSLYVQSQGITPASIGVIISGWAIGRLIAEPPSGWWADRHSRKPQMVVALLHRRRHQHPHARLHLASRALHAALHRRCGLGHVRARGPRRARRRHRPGLARSGLRLLQRLHERRLRAGPGHRRLRLPRSSVATPSPSCSWACWGSSRPPSCGASLPGHTRVPDLLHRAGGTESSLAKTGIHASAAERVCAEPEPRPPTQAPLRAVFNRTLIAAVIIGFGLQLTFGIYDVVWPLFLIDLGAERRPGSASPSCSWACPR